MEGAARLIEVICKYFERLLRWVYPGALFWVLVLLSPVSGYFKDTFLINYWLIVLAVVTIGAIIYIVQSAIVNTIIGLILILLSNRCKQWGNFLNSHYANRILNRYPTKDKANEYLNYAWAFYHATSITAWLPLSFFLSPKLLFPGEPVVAGIGWLLLISSIFLHAVCDKIVEGIKNLP